MTSPNFTYRMFLDFDQMVATRVVKLIYYFGLIIGTLAFVAGLAAALGEIGDNFGSGLGGLVIAFVAAAFGLLVWRVICESMIVVFGIYDRLSEIRELLKTGQRAF